MNKARKIPCAVIVLCAIFAPFLIMFWGMLIHNAMHEIRFNAINNIETMEYRTDIEPLQRRFPYYFNNSHKIFWKTGRYHSGVLPPGSSDIWFKGFIFLNATDFDALKLEYDWTNIELIFEEGMDPSITGFDSFKWHSSEKIRRVLRHEYFYQGNFYLDKINMILYFDFSTT